jgi:hypothetical protein
MSWLTPRACRSPLLLAVVAASAVHALALSFVQVSRRHQTPAPASVRSHDNTPELLQFSTRMASQPSLAELPLPKARTLPPPAPRLARPAVATASTKRSSMRGTPTAGLVPKSRSLGVVKRKALPTRATRQPDQPPALTAAIAHLRAFQRRLPSPTAGSDGGASLPIASNDQTMDGFRVSDADDTASMANVLALWNQAAPWRQATGAKDTAKGGTEAMDIRRLALQPKQSLEPAIQHQQFVVGQDSIMLLWLDGQKLWLLRSGRQ